jgi:hypothetical protein
MSGLEQSDPVVLSDALDTSSDLPAQPLQLADPSCFNGRFDGGIRPIE